MSLEQVGQLLREYGLPLAMLLGLFTALVVRRGNRTGPDDKQHAGSPYLVPGAQVDDLKDELLSVRMARDKREFQIREDAAKQVGYVEMLRIEEKRQREAAEARLDTALARLDKVAELGQRQLEETIRGGKA